MREAGQQVAGTQRVREEIAVSSKRGLLAALLWMALPLHLGAQLVPGAPKTDWDRAHSEFTLDVLRQYNALMGDWRDRLHEGNASKAALHYSATAQVLVTGHGPIQGRDSIAVWLGEFASTLIEVRMSVSDFVASDRLAFAAGALLFSARADSAATAVRPFTGRHVTVLLREGRNWRIHSQVLHFTPTEPAGAGPLPPLTLR